MWKTALFCLTISATFGFLPQSAAQTKAPATPPAADVLLLTDGERLSGHFVKSAGKTLTFKSDALGNITVDWSKVKELQTDVKVAVIPKAVRLRRREAAADIPQGTLAVENQQVHLTPAPPKPIAVADTNAIVDQAAFQKALAPAGFFSDWKGNITLGASVVNATQQSESFNGALNLVRAIPTEDWLEPRNKTIFDLSDSYGEVSQKGTPSVITSIFHGDAERDEYFSPRLYFFGQGAFDHNYSQGLQLQETYSGGVGYSIIQRDNEVLDIKGSVSYIRQQFVGVPNQNLIGSIFAEDFNRKFVHGFTLDQHLMLTPTWNNTNDYSALFNVHLIMPVYKHFAGSLGFIDSYLNDPPPAFRKNSVQITMGVTYSLP